MAMSVTKWLMNKFKDINKDRMNRHIEIIQQQSGKSKFYIKCSLAWNFLTQGTGYTDYFRGHFIDRTKEEKKTYATAKRFYRLMAYLNDEEYIVVLGDKLIFDEVFRDYLKRDFINLRKYFFWHIIKNYFAVVNNNNSVSKSGFFHIMCD